MFIVTELAHHAFRIFDFIKMVRRAYLELESNIITNTHICVFSESTTYNDKIQDQNFIDKTKQNIYSSKSTTTIIST